MQTAGGCVQTTFMKCADSGKEGVREVQAENVRVSLFGDLCVQAMVYVFHLVGNHRESASRGDLIRRTNLHLNADSSP